MEGALELEDDIFFKDLSKQISLLIMDDDDEHSLSHAPPLNLQGFSEAMNPARQTSSFLKYDEYVERSKRSGTGVFIPLCSNPRRKINNHGVKQGRFMASGNYKFQRPAAHHNSTGLPHTHINQSHDHSFKLTRF